MDLDEIEKRLKRGQTKFGKLSVHIDTDGIGGRYRAFIETPLYNTMVETPDLVGKEGILSFYKRLSIRLMELIGECE